MLIRPSIQIGNVFYIISGYSEANDDDYLSPLLEAVKCFIQYKVPATDYDLSGK